MAATTKALKFAAAGATAPSNQVSNQYATISAVTIDWGLDYYVIEFSLATTVTPTQNVGVLGRNGTPAGVAITTTNQIAFYTSGIMRYATAAATMNLDGNFHTYKIVHNAASAPTNPGKWELFIDGVSTETGTYTTSNTAAMTFINKLSNGSNTGIFGQLSTLEIQRNPLGSGTLTTTKWDATLSNGSGSLLKSVGGTNDAALVSTMPTDNTQWAGFDYVATMNVGLGWLVSERNYSSLDAWYTAKKTSSVFETAVCSGDIGSSFISMAATDFPGGALIKGATEYNGSNHTSLAKRTRQVLIQSNSGNVTMQDIWLTDSNGSQPTATVSGAGNVIQRCFIEHTANPGTNSAIAVSSNGGEIKNCVVRNAGTTSVRSIRAASSGIVSNCVAIGSVSAIYTEWTNSKTINSYAVKDTTTTACQNYPNGVPALNANNASEDATPATGTTTTKNVVPSTVFKDFAANDFRIISTTSLGVANIGAFFYTPSTPYTDTLPKGSVTLSGKQPNSLSLGWTSAAAKRAGSVSYKTPGLSLGLVITLPKSSLSITPKALEVKTSQSLTIGKQHFSPTMKSISLGIGAIVEILDGSSLVDGKELGISAGVTLSLNKARVNVDGKQVSLSLGWTNTIGKGHVTVNGKPLAAVTGSNVPFIGVLNKASLNITGKTLSLETATSVSYTATLVKTHLSVSEKVLSVYTGNVLDLKVRHLTLNGKKLRLVSTPEIKFIHIARLYNLRY